MTVNGKYLTAALLVVAAGVGFWAGNSTPPHLPAGTAAETPAAARTVSKPVPATPQLDLTANAAVPAEPEVPPVEDPVPQAPALVIEERNPYHQMQESLGREVTRPDTSSYADRALQIEGEPGR